jgi:glycosyltransferase involved in cell wall biosynthesis
MIRDLPRVGFVSHSPWIAGAERALIALLEHLPEREIQPIVIFPSTDGPVKALAAKTLPFPLFELPYRFTVPMVGQNDWERRVNQEVAAFANLYRELELDAVVVNTTVIYPASAAAVRAKLPLLVHSHGPVLPRAFRGLDWRAWQNLDSLQLHMADLVLVPSNWVLAHARAACNVPGAAIRVLPNGTDLPPLGADADPCAQSGTPEFVMLCTLEPHKGVLTFLEAAATLLAQRPGSARFSVYGDGAPQYREELWRSIKRHNLGNSCSLRPKQHAAPIYRDCTAAIVASEFEPFSLVAIEAMSYARPVIATRCGGPEDIVEDEKTGYLVSIGDSEALAERMIRLMDSPALARQMGMAGRERVESRYDIRKAARDYLNSILEVIDKPRSLELLERKRHLGALSALQAPTMDRPEVRHWAEDNRIVSDLYAQVTAHRPSRIAGIASFFGRKDVLWASVSPAFSEIKSYTDRHVRRSSRAHLVLGVDLAAIPYREYVIRFKVDSLTKVSLAIRPLQHGTEGTVGIEIVSLEGRVLSHVEVPLRDVRHDVATHFVLPACLSELCRPWCLRVFARNAAVPVAIWELMRHSVLRSKIHYMPFVLLG